jgi:hypothetical protein
LRDADIRGHHHHGDERQRDAYEDEAGQIGALAEQTADGFPVIGRQNVHGSLFIVGAETASNP